MNGKTKAIIASVATAVIVGCTMLGLWLGGVFDSGNGEKPNGPTPPPAQTLAQQIIGTWDAPDFIHVAPDETPESYLRFVFRNDGSFHLYAINEVYESGWYFLVEGDWEYTNGKIETDLEGFYFISLEGNELVFKFVNSDYAHYDDFEYVYMTFTRQPNFYSVIGTWVSTGLDGGVTITWVFGKGDYNTFVLTSNVGMAGEGTWSVYGTTVTLHSANPQINGVYFVVEGNTFDLVMDPNNPAESLVTFERQGRVGATPPNGDDVSYEYFVDTFWGYGWSDDRGWDFGAGPLFTLTFGDHIDYGLYFSLMDWYTQYADFTIFGIWNIDMNGELLFQVLESESFALGTDLDVNFDGNSIRLEFPCGQVLNFEFIARF
ncbi:MAG: hypothetical protein FWC00_06510 [Firmicutes bacterium]|nr:hypothetical protein [Bacillota bacterium]